MSARIVRSQVIVVGAGFTGLSAAQLLRHAGVDFIVIEARERVGGRVEAVENGLGERIDAGGQYFCDDMPEISALADAYGKTRADGLFAGRWLIEPGTIVGTVEDLYRRSASIRHRANELDPDDPSIENVSVRAWAEAQPDAYDAQWAFLGTIEGLWCQPTDLLPLWYLVSNDRRITNEVPELQYFLKETMQSLAEDLGRELGPRLRLGEAVRSIRHGPDKVSIRTDAGLYEAEHAIVAVPPVMTRRLMYDPPLPVEVCQATSAWRSGKVIKALVRYEKPFWRDKGFSGSVFFLDPLGLYACDASRDDDHAAIVVFAGGSLAEKWRKAGNEAARTMILEKLATALGPAAAAPLDVTMRDWTNDPWSGGGYFDTIMDFSAKDAEAIMRRGIPSVTFASSELSPSYPGYIEGAIVAGRAAAQQAVVQTRAARADPDKALAILERIGGLPPEPGDEMPERTARQVFAPLNTKTP
ncbi:flavin monoamine oxidase family protein [Mesorhizobium sp. LHD-90]|uniref:flavin monoamine oxidase family protein n=1 Tax=Mesorhizobium sp. LHD-90 TaxID=3071414 RepID=UPI0027E156DE|nr:flavin monoamine oxidase family protein [Mesorhizobium sp. LHD-90]MDQ6432767.1 flavin monoamine oxidase family protein [Mesorhizobium sp. LHD-90]